MSTILFTEQENGNLKLIAEVDIDNPALAVDALLDETPRLKDREFMALVGTADEGVFTRVVVEDDEPINPRRQIRVTGSVNGGDAAEKPAPKRRGRPPKAQADEAVATPKRRGRPPKAAATETKIDGRTKEGRAARAAAEAPKRRGRPPGSGKKVAAKPAGRKPAAKKGSSPFKRNAASDD